MQNETPRGLVGKEEAAYFLRAILLLIQNKSQYSSAFYGQNAVLSRSFIAYLWCLPAYLFMWSTAWRNHFSQLNDVGLSRSEFIFFAGAFDLVAWLMVALAVAFVSTVAGQRQSLVPLVIATNWYNLFAVYVYFIPASLSFLFPATKDVVTFINFITFLVLVWLYFRVIRQTAQNNKMLAFAITLANVVIALAMSEFTFAYINA